MKKLVITFVMLLTSVVIRAGEVPLLGNVLNRPTTTLNGDWNYIVDVQECGYYDYRHNKLRWGFFQNAKPKQPEDLIEYDFDKSDKMQIPSDWNTRDQRLFLYEGTVWFKRSFNYQPKPAHRTLH